MAKLKIKTDDTIRKRLHDIGDEFVVVAGGGNEVTKIYFREEQFDSNSAGE